MAEGEFALVRDYLAAASDKPLTAWGLFFHDNELHAMYLDMAVRQRDEPALRKYAPLADMTATRDGHNLHQASAHRGWGVLHRLQGEYAMAEKRLNQALEIFQELETRWQIGRTFYELGELAQAQNNPDSAGIYFSRAMASFKEMNAIPDIMNTQAALASLD